MDTEVKSLANIKAMEGRNLDSSVDENTLVSGEKADGTFGVFNFFKGIRNFFKGISALGTLASGSRLPVTDANGNVTYTTMGDINNYVVNNALANQTNYNVIMNIADCNEAYSTSTKFSVYRTSSITLNRPMSDKLFVIYANTYNDGTNIRVTQIAYENGADGNIYSYTRKGYKSGNEGMTWTSWQKLTTESDLNYCKNITAVNQTTREIKFPLDTINWFCGTVYGNLNNYGNIAFSVAVQGSTSITKTNVIGDNTKITCSIDTTTKEFIMTCDSSVSFKSITFIHS